jgi:hypothetical protein
MGQNQPAHVGADRETLLAHCYVPHLDVPVLLLLSPVDEQLTLSDSSRTWFFDGGSSPDGLGTNAQPRKVGSNSTATR